MQCKVYIVQYTPCSVHCIVYSVQCTVLYCPLTLPLHSSSWGPVDDGKKMDGPGLLVKSAFEEGVKYVSLFK